MIIITDVNIVLSALIKDSIIREIILKSEQDFCFPEPSLRGEAKEIMKSIDPEDVPFIAAALSQENGVIWSEDRHFEKQRRTEKGRRKK